MQTIIYNAMLYAFKKGKRLSNVTMTDSEYIEYAKAVHEEIYAMSSPMIDGIANKVLTRIRKEQHDLMELKRNWLKCPSVMVDVVDVLSVLAHKCTSFDDMHPQLENILGQYIIDRYEELDPKTHLLVKFRYIGESELVAETKRRIYECLKEHYATKRMVSLMERYPDLKEV